MRFTSTLSRLVGLTLALLTATAAPALAQKVATSPDDSPLSSPNAVNALNGAQPAAATLYNFDVTGIFSNDPLGAAINERRQINVGANALITGIGWNVTLFADSPSWLSEMSVGFFDDADVLQVALTPGVGDNAPGTATYSSGGVVDLVGLGLAFNVGASGILTLEFFESFDDFPNDWDGIWDSGLLTIEATTVDTVVPEPTTVGLLAFGLVAIAAVQRRRKA